MPEHFEWRVTEEACSAEQAGEERRILFPSTLAFLHESKTTCGVRWNAWTLRDMGEILCVVVLVVRLRGCLRVKGGEAARQTTVIGVVIEGLVSQAILTRDPSSRVGAFAGRTGHRDAPISPKVFVTNWTGSLGRFM